jgi:hypothetical protein
MIDQIKDIADRAYGYWNSAALWVGTHPKTTIGTAIAAVLAALWLGGAF